MLQNNQTLPNSVNVNGGRMSSYFSKVKHRELVSDMHTILCDLTCCLNHDLLPLPGERSDLRKTYTLITLAKFHENFRSRCQHLLSIINHCCHHKEDPGDMIHLNSEVTYFRL